MPFGNKKEDRESKKMFHTKKRLWISQSNLDAIQSSARLKGHLNQLANSLAKIRFLCLRTRNLSISLKFAVKVLQMPRWKKVQVTSLKRINLEAVCRSTGSFKVQIRWATKRVQCLKSQGVYGYGVRKTREWRKTSCAFKNQNCHLCVIRL